MPGSRNVTGGNGGKGFSGARNVAGVRIFRGLAGYESSTGSAASARHQLDRDGTRRVAHDADAGGRPQERDERAEEEEDGVCMDGGRLLVGSRLSAG